MTYESSTGTGRSTGRTAAVAILVIIALLAIVAGALYLAEPAKSLPSVMGAITSPASRANAHRDLRGWISIVIAVVLLVAAWFVARMKGSAQQ
jgi:amino acid permease